MKRLLFYFLLIFLTLGCTIESTSNSNVKKVHLIKRILDIEVAYPTLNIPVSSQGFPLNFEITIKNKGNKTVKGIVCILGVSNWKIVGVGDVCKNYTVKPRSYEIVKIPGRSSVFLVTPTIAEETKEIKIKNCYIYDAEAEINLCLATSQNIKCQHEIHTVTGAVEFKNIQVLPTFYDPNKKEYVVYITFDIVKREDGVIVDPDKIDIIYRNCPPYKPDIVNINVDVKPLVPQTKIRVKCSQLQIIDKGRGTCVLEIPETYLKDKEGYFYLPIKLTFRYGFETLDTIYLHLIPVRIEKT